MDDKTENQNRRPGKHERKGNGEEIPRQQLCHGLGVIGRIQTSEICYPQVKEIAEQLFALSKAKGPSPANTNSVINGTRNRNLMRSSRLICLQLITSLLPLDPSWPE